MNRKLFCGSDFVIIACIILASVVLGVFMRGSDSADIAQIYKGSELIASVSLNENSEFTVEGADGFVFCVENNSICVKTSPCENKICVNTGCISRGNETIVCLPERICVRTSVNDGFDAVVG